MAVCESIAPPMRFLCSLPEPLDANSIGETQDNTEVDEDLDFLEWTLTPHLTILKDNNSKCFIATPQTAKGSRQHALHLVREFDIQPARVIEDPFSSRKKTTLKRDPCGEPRQIRVREEDLRKCGANLGLLTQYALPPLPRMIDILPPPKKGKENARAPCKKGKDDKCAIKPVSRPPALELDCSCEFPLSLEDGKWNDKSHRTPKHRRSHTFLKHCGDEAFRSERGDLLSQIWMSTFNRAAGPDRMKSSAMKASRLAPRASLPKGSVFGPSSALPKGPALRASVSLPSLTP